MAKVIFLSFLLACKPHFGTNQGVPVTNQGIDAPTEITSIQVTALNLIINGRSLQDTIGIKIQSNNHLVEKNFDLESVSPTQLVARSADTVSLPVNTLLELILSSATAQTPYPITFSIPNNSVTPQKLTNDAADPVSQYGYVLTWTNQGVKFSPPGGGTGSGVIAGEGIAAQSVAGGTMISVEVGTTGNPTKTIIPYFNSLNRLVLNENAELNLVPSASSTGYSYDYSIYANATGDFAIKDGTLGAVDLLTIDKTGKVEIPNSLFVNGNAVCVDSGTGCGAGAITVTATPPMQVTAAPNINISANVGIGANQLLQLNGLAQIPAVDGALLRNVQHGINAGPGITVIPGPESSTVSVIYGVGGAQSWSSVLENLSTLIPVQDGVIIGSGTGFVVKSGNALQTTLDYQSHSINLDQLSSPLNYPGELIAGDPLLGYIGKAIANCGVNQLLSSNGTSFNCSASFPNFSFGTVTSTLQTGVVLNPVGAGTGELHFVEFGPGTNYVGLKAPAAVSSNTVWILPASDGLTGQVLSTNGAKTLGWTTLTGGVSNVGGAVTNNFASFADNTGQVVKDSGISALTAVSGPGVATVAGELAVYNNLTGTLLGTTGVLIGNVVQGATSSTANYVPLFSSGSGKVLSSQNTLMVGGGNVGIGLSTPAEKLDVVGNIKSSGNIVSGGTLSVGTGASSIAGTLTVGGSSVCTADGTNCLSKMVGPATTTVGNLASWNNTTGTSLSDSGLIAGNVITKTTNFSGANRVALAAGANRSLTETGYTIPSTVCTNGQVLKSDGVNFSCSNQNNGDVAGPAASTDNAIARFDGIDGKKIQDSSIIVDDTSNITGINSLTANATMTVDTNTFIVAANTNRVGILTTSPTEALDVRGNARLGSGAAVGNLKFYDTDASNYVAFQSTGVVAANVTWTLPGADGSSGQVLQTNGAGALSWEDPNALSYPSAQIFSFYNPLYTENAAAGAGNNPPVLAANSNGIHSSDANWTATVFLPAAGYLANGTPFYFKRESTVAWTVDKTRTNMANNLAVKANSTAVFLYNGATNLYEYQGQISNNAISPSLTFNNLGNSYSMPTGRGSNGQVLLTDGAGAATWTSDLTAIKSFRAKGDNTNTPNAMTSAIDFMIGRTNNQGLVTNQTTADLAFEYGGGGFKHYLVTTHNAAVNSNTNSIRFYLNNGVLAGDSSSPGTNNTMAMSVTQQGVGIFDATPTVALDVTGSVASTGQISSGSQSITTGAVNWDNGNIVSTSYDCAANITFANLKDGGTYTLIVTSTNTTQCTFNVNTTGIDAAAVNYRFRPINQARAANTHSIYTLMRVGTTVYVSWGTNF